MIDAVDVSSVTICGQVVRRPSSVSPSQWIAYWTEEDLQRRFQEEYERGLSERSDDH